MSSVPDANLVLVGRHRNNSSAEDVCVRARARARACVRACMRACVCHHQQSPPQAHTLQRLVFQLASTTRQASFSPLCSTKETTLRRQTLSAQIRTEDHRTSLSTVQRYGMPLKGHWHTVPNGGLGRGCWLYPRVLSQGHGRLLPTPCNCGTEHEGRQVKHRKLCRAQVKCRVTVKTDAQKRQAGRRPPT